MLHEYEKLVDTEGLQREIIAAGIPFEWITTSVGPAGEPRVQIEAPEASATALAAAVAAHDPAYWASQREAMRVNEQTIQQRLTAQIDVLRAARDAITAGTLFAALGNQERVLLRNLIRNEIALIRLAIRQLESAE